MQKLSPRRRGFTLIELLFVAAIVALLSSLLPSAIQQARENARQTVCRNNLLQIGLAVHNYHDIFGAFPPGWNAHVSNPGNGPRIGWQVSILPQVDQAPLYERIDFNLDLPEVVRAEKSDEPTEADELWVQTQLSVYRCPSDPTSATNPMRGNYGTSNYSGNHGSLTLPRWTTGRTTVFWPGQIDTPRKANGLFYWNSSVRFREITDGPSNTFLVGERSVTSGAGVWPGVGSNAMENDAVTECSHASRLNRGLTTFSSPHKGIVQFLFCDGSVHSINENIDSKPITQGELGTFQRLANRHDGLVVGEF